MAKGELSVDALIESEGENKELTERLRVACETIEQLKRVNKEWEALWEPIDELVRPLTPLGESVGNKVVELIRENVLNERQYLPLGWSVILPERGSPSLGSNIGLSDGGVVQLINEYHSPFVFKFLEAITND